MRTKHLRLTLYDKVVDILRMTKEVHIFLEFALLLCAFSQPKCLDTLFHLLRKRLPVPVSRSAGTIEKVGLNRLVVMMINPRFTTGSPEVVLMKLIYKQQSRICM